MSALGETVENGASGTVTKVAPLPDQIQDNPTTIVANTSVETIDHIMNRDYVFRGIYPIDTSMQTGHVFGIIKIHPQNIHDYLTYISALFLTWTGGATLRARFLATFQFGGSFRVGFLPPKFTEDQVRNMPIQTLTAYPNVDLDPKNTGWSTFHASDERNVLFHWMSDLSDQDPQSFAGYYVFYVTGPLVVSGTASSVNLLVEAAGNFQFSQLAPISTIKPSSNSWLNAGLINLFGQPGCDDHTQIESLWVAPISIKAATIGWINAKAAGGRAPEEAFPDAVLGLTQKQARNYSLVGNASASITSTNPPGIAMDTNLGTVMRVNTIGILNTIYEIDSVAPKVVQLTKTGNVSINSMWNPADQLAPAKHAMLMNMEFQPDSDALTPTQLNCAFDYSDETSLPNLCPSESILFFCSRTGTNLQTSQIAWDLSQLAQPASQNSQLFQLYRSDNPTPLLTVRLQPNGMFSTRAIDVEARFTTPKGVSLYLRYLQDLPITSPIPGSTSEARQLRAAQRFARGPMTNDRILGVLYSGM